MPTIYDLHLPTEKKLQSVMASPNAVAIFNDATHLPYELAFGLTEKCTVAPMDEKSGVYCVTKSDDPAVTGFYTLIQVMSSHIIKKTRLSEPPVYCVSPGAEGGMRVTMTMNPVGRKSQAYDLSMPDDYAINNCCVSMRWEIGHVEIPFTPPVKADHATLQKTEALWAKVCEASESAISKISGNSPAMSVEILK